MTGCIAQRKDIYYVRLVYYDKNHQRKEKWVSTGLSGRGAKKKATAMIDSMVEKYIYLEKSDHPSKMADYLAMWKNLRQSEVAETTYDGYHTYIDRHLIPYFKDLNLDIQDITAGHIFDYVNYLSNDGGRKDNKIGGQSITSIRKIISILRQVFDYAVLYGDIKINPACKFPCPRKPVRRTKDKFSSLRKMLKRCSMRFKMKRLVLLCLLHWYTHDVHNCPELFLCLLRCKF